MPDGSFDIAEAARRINSENREEAEQAAARRREAREEAVRIAAELRAKDPCIKGIWGFGSTFEPALPYRLDSDIDLAIEGGDIIALLAVAERARFKVDLVDIGDRDDYFARRIRSEGVAL
jgi:predicted nucleotidyltransferase